MIRQSVSYAPEALDDLSSLYDWIEGRTSPETAFSYMARLLAHLESFDLGAERGTRRDDIRPGLRIVGFERRVTIAFGRNPRPHLEALLWRGELDRGDLISRS